MLTDRVAKQRALVVVVSDFRGPEPTRLLEPPGFLVRNYGSMTPWVLLFAHVMYGAMLGTCYALH